MKKRSYSTTELARMWDVSESTIKRWADRGMLRCRKTAGGHRKFDLEVVVEFQSRTGMVPCRSLSKSGLPAASEDMEIIESLVAARDFSALADLYRQAAIGAKNGLTSTLLRLASQEGFDLVEIAEKIIRPAMQEIGDLWRAGRIQVFEEHLASSATMQALSDLKTVKVENHGSAGLALVGCCEGEHHQIASIIVCRVIEKEGWSVLYLGPHTPLFSFADAIIRLKPQIVCISITMIDNLERASRDYEVLRRAALRQGTRIILGGTALGNAGVQTRFQEASYAASMYDLLEIAAGRSA